MPQSVNVAQVKELLKEGAQLVDVLAPEEYVEEHLPGAINIPIKQLDADTAAQLDRSKPVIAYCHDAL